MMNKTIVLCCVSCGLFLVLALGGCGKQEEPTPEAVTVQSFKIEKAVTPASESPARNGDGLAPESESPGQEGGVVTPASEPPVQEAGAVTQESETPGESGGVVPVTPDSPEAPPVTGGDTPSDAAPSQSDASIPAPPVEAAMAVPVTVPALALESDSKGGAEPGYDPAGRVDPFEPLFQARQEKMATGSMKSQTIRDARRGKLTPLEKMDISQLSLTAIIQGQQRNVAMVQESTGKGHVIKKGTYIGINSGRVVEITKNTVVIEEEVEDLLGKIIVRKREMKLQKPLGDM